MNDIEIIEKQDALIKQLRDELELKDKCLSLIAHDFKGLFSNILWVLAAYKNGTITKSEFESMLPEIKQNAQINLNLINDTFKWVNAQRYEGDLLFEDVHIYSLVSELKGSLQSLIKNKNISFLQIGDPSLVFKSNPILLKFVIKKLIENAIKFSYLDGEIEIEARMIGPNVHLFVKDKGTGISEGSLHDIFTLNGASFLGTQGEKGGGLSLVIVNDFVKALNGEIKISSNNDDKGTIVELIFSLE